MLARVKEFDGDDDKWLAWRFKMQSFLKANHLGYEVMIERIVAETDVANLNNAVLSAADKKLSSSLYYVLGLTMSDERKSLRLLLEYQPDIVNRHLGLLMLTMNWSIRPTDPVTAINELDLRMNAYELQSGEKMADTVKRGVLLKGLARGEGFSKTECLCTNGSRSVGSSSCRSRAPAHEYRAQEMYGRERWKQREN